MFFHWLIIKISWMQQYCAKIYNKVYFQVIVFCMYCLQSTSSDLWPLQSLVYVNFQLVGYWAAFFLEKSKEGEMGEEGILSFSCFSVAFLCSSIAFIYSFSISMGTLSMGTCSFNIDSKLENVSDSSFLFFTLPIFFSTASKIAAALSRPLPTSVTHNRKSLEMKFFWKRQVASGVGSAKTLCRSFWCFDSICASSEHCTDSEELFSCSFVLLLASSVWVPGCIMTAERW